MLSDRHGTSSASQNKPFKGIGMNGWIAQWYARTRSNDMEDFRLRAKAVKERLRPGSNLLEVAPGPGFFAIELAKLGDFRITGLDISQTFVDIATQNASKAGVDIDFRLGNASTTPFPDSSFDFVYCSAAFKNFSEPIQALNEMHRVLRPGGQALIEDLRRDASLDEINSYIRQSGRKWFDVWMTRWTFRNMLIKRAYSQADFQRMALQSSFAACNVSCTGIGLEVHFQKPDQPPITTR